MVCVLSNVPVSGTLLPAGQMAQQPDSQLINAAKRELSRPSEAISFCTILTFCNKTYFEERDRIYYIWKVTRYEGIYMIWRRCVCKLCFVPSKKFHETINSTCLIYQSHMKSFWRCVTCCAPCCPWHVRSSYVDLSLGLTWSDLGL